MARFPTFLILCSLVAPPGTAAAHAIVVESTPGSGAVVGDGVEVAIRFNSRIDHRRSRLMLVDKAGKAEPVTLEQDAPIDTLRAHLRRLPPGDWRLQWQVLAIDGHVTRGEIPFRSGD